MGSLSILLFLFLILLPLSHSAVSSIPAIFEVEPQQQHGFTPLHRQLTPTVTCSGDDILIKVLMLDSYGE